MDIRKQLETARKHHAAAAGYHQKLSSAIDDRDLKAARRAADKLGDALAGAAEAVRAALDANYEEPTHNPGAQVSDGHSPRRLTIDDVRARDQRRAVEFIYRQRAGGR